MLDNSGSKSPEALLMALCFKIVPADLYRIVSHDHSFVARGGMISGLFPRAAWEQ
jgi:hypothetical protein